MSTYFSSRLFLTFSATIAITTFTILAEMPSEENIEVESNVSTIDTINIDTINTSLESNRLSVDMVSNKYRELKKLEFEEGNEASFYPALMDLYTDILRVVDTAEGSDQQLQLKNILIDINSIFLKGAFHYSSVGDQGRLTDFSRAYIDMQELPVLSDYEFKNNPQIYPTIVYCAACGTYNSADFENAKRYFEIYLSTGDDTYRHQISNFMLQACLNTKDYLKGLNILNNAIQLYPDDYQLVALGIQCCIDGGYADRMQPLLDRALLMKPGDEKLLNVQAQVFEANKDYRKALDIYNVIAEQHPTSLENTQRIATCNFNLGVQFYNNSIMEEDEKVAKKNRRQSKAYFETSAELFEQILVSVPNSPQYLKALGISYGCLDEKEKFGLINTRLLALGEKGITFGEMPQVINGPLKRGGDGGHNAFPISSPSYQQFASELIEGQLGKWAQRGEFERIEDYQKRVTEGGLQSEYDRLRKDAEMEYLNKFAVSIVLTDLQLHQYDVENETYMITTPYGNATIKVPLKNGEAETFKKCWNNNNVEIRTPRYMIDNDQLALASISFRTIYGKMYSYDSNNAASYDGAPEVKIDLNKFIKTSSNDLWASTKNKQPSTGIIGKISDVDRDIPESKKPNDNVFAFIVANENYKNVANVASALHDGDIFKQYCSKTLGIPSGQITFLSDATMGDFWSAYEDIRNRVALREGPTDIVFYYSGHGLPDNATKDAFLMPIDAQPQHSRTMMKLQEVLDGLSAIPNANLIAFMDACFSGSARENGTKDTPLIAARGVAVKHTSIQPKGSLFVLSATSPQQAAFPYEEKDHGMFTYWLLKKLQSSKGNASLSEISEYVKENVDRTSREINGRPQTPEHHVSGMLAEYWKSKKLK